MRGTRIAVRSGKISQILSLIVVGNVSSVNSASLRCVVLVCPATSGDTRFQQTLIVYITLHDRHDGL